MVMFHPLSSSAWANVKLAEVAEQVGKMMELPKSTQVRQEMLNPVVVCEHRKCGIDRA